MLTIEDLISKKREALNAEIENHNELADQLNDLRAQDAPDEVAVTTAREAKAAAGAKVKELRAELATFEDESKADREVGEKLEVREETDAPKPEQRAKVTETNPVYRRDNLTEVSYFRDLFDASTGLRAAQDRLVRSQETRAATSVAGAGGEFAPPEWLIEDFVALARPGRIAADQMQIQALPEGISSINLPKVTADTNPAVTQTQNTTLTESAFTTTSVSSGITEVSGKETVSIALLRQSGTPLDRVILSDLAAGYATALDVQVISGSNANGQLRGLVTAGTTVTYTTSAPRVVSTTAADSFYGKVLKAMSAVSAGRYLPADKILMTPTRWNWVLNALDSSNRPLVTPNGAAFNQVAVTGGPVAEGFAGELLGLPVFVDPNIPQTIGAATNQDYVFVLRTADLWLWESPVETATFDATLAAQNSILFRVLGFAAFIPHRQAASVQVIDGTGLVAPSF